MGVVLILIIIGAYLLGSVPFGLLLAGMRGKNLREIGSGNIGATNVARALGKKWAYVCFFLDVCKGLIPMLAAMAVLSRMSNLSTALCYWLWLAAGSAAVVGHCFPLYLRFKGGKGVATSLGVALGLWPYYTVCAVIAFVVWITIVLTSRYVSLASIVASLTFPLMLFAMILAMNSWVFADLWPLQVVSLAIPLMVLMRHKANIVRLLNGTEDKIGRKHAR